MSDMKIGKIQKIALRELWKREDTNFTTWLEENIDHLTDVLGFDIDIKSREKAVGPFSVDLYGEDANENKVIIENQLKKTDHSHLGQTLTYLVNLEAKTAIWITSEAVEEHKRVFDWLNETTPNDISFYLVQLEAVRINDDSVAAPLFTVVAEPSVQIKQIGAERVQDAERHTLLKEFWTQFIDRAAESSKIFENANLRSSNWLSVPIFVSGVALVLSIANTHVICGVYMLSGDRERNKIIFDALFSKKEQIEADFQSKLDWQRLEDNVRSKVVFQLSGVNVSKKEDWPKITEFLITHSKRMHEAFEKYTPEIRKLTK